MPLPALGTRRIIKGNGTIVGTVISLQCPAKHKLVGGELMCIMDTNSTRWVGDNYCKRKFTRRAGIEEEKESLRV